MSKLIKAIKCLFLLSGLFLIVTVSAYAQTVLIFSTSHNNTGPSDIEEAVGTLKLDISTFNPIKEIMVNEEILSPQKPTRGYFEVPYQLNPGENRFEVKVITEATEESKEFILNLIDDKTALISSKKKPWQIATIVGLQSSDNITNLPEGFEKKGAAKLVLTLNPSYKLSLSGGSDFTFKSIILKEKINDPELADLEISFAQLAIDWQHRSFLKDWKLSLGYNDIGINNTGISAEYHIESDIFLSASMNKKIIKNHSWNLEAKFTKKTLEDTENENQNGNGNNFAVKTSWKSRFAEFKGKLKLALEANDALGKYADYNAANLGIEADYSLMKTLKVGGALNQKNTIFSEEDPIKGEQEKTSLKTVAVKASYDILWIEGLKTLVDIKQKSQSSNIDSHTYQALILSLSALYIF